ncbi:16S rRNA (guanine(527)-N(7))-methyltransferase RsmG [Lysobacteraceae bacterium NML120232]|nr:16S rRNA (guanine(527)-N(7))-methyltransferase RsmG [Xanthomonadaceae bacterium NML120232]
MNTSLPADIEPLLRQGLAELALDADALTPALMDYLALLTRWNGTYNLTAIRDPREMVTKHLLDSLAMAPFVPDAALADLGTGPGLPGIPLAIARPGCRVTLVESNGKKARFLREAVRTLGLVNARVAESRAEALDEPGQYAAITARALATLDKIIAFGGHLLAPDGVLLAMKAETVDEEAAQLPPGWQLQAVHPLQVPGLTARRQLAVVGRSLTAS